MRFLHAADIHLGNQQYNCSERFNDFYRAFQQITQTAIDQQVDVCILAGDLFHKSAVDPLTLMQAENCLRAMQEAGIRVLAVAGNHDRQRYQDNRTWLHYLAWNKRLTLLEPALMPEEPNCLVADKCYVDIGGARFIGIPYFGAATTAVLQKVIEELPLLDWSVKIGARIPRKIGIKLPSSDVLWSARPPSVEALARASAQNGACP